MNKTKLSEYQNQLYSKHKYHMELQNWIIIIIIISVEKKMNPDITQYRYVNQIPKDAILMEDEYKVQHLFSDEGNGQGIVYVVVKDNKMFAAKLFKSLIEYQIQINCLLKIDNKNPFTCKLIHHNRCAKIQRNNHKILNMPLIITEFCQHGDLTDFIRAITRNRAFISTEKSFTFKTSVALLQQILIGLKQIHQIGYLHRDLKCQNILIDQNFQLKIGDFGLATTIDNASTKLMTGTPLFRPPQSFIQQDKTFYYGPQSDIFTCGLIFFRLSFFKDLTVQKLNNNKYEIYQVGAYAKYFANEQVNKNAQPCWRYLQKESGKVKIPSQIKNFFYKILRQDRNQRPTIDQILSSKLMKYRATAEQVKQQLSSYQKKLLSIETEIHRIKIQALKQQLENIAKEAEQIIDETMEDEQKRSHFTQTHFQELFQYYQKSFSEVDLQALEKSTNIYSKYAFQSHPAFVFAWIQYFIESNIMKNLDSIFDSMIGQRAISDYKLDFDKQTKTLALTMKFEAKSFFKQEQSEQRGQNVINQIGNQNIQQKDNNIYELQVQGQLQRRQTDNKYIIDWSTYPQQIFNGKILIKQLKQCMVAIVKYQEEKNKL